MLMQAERLPHEPPRAIAHHGPADPATGDHAQARRRTRRQPLPVGDQAAEGQAFAGPAHPGEIPALLDARRAAKRQALWRTGGHWPAGYTGVKRLRPTRRRLARMPRPLLLALRARKPCCRLRRTFDGWYCRFINQFSSYPARAHPQDRCVRKHSANGAREHNSRPPPVKRAKLAQRATPGWGAGQNLARCKRVAPVLLRGGSGIASLLFPCTSLVHPLYNRCTSLGYPLGIPCAYFAISAW